MQTVKCIRNVALQTPRSLRCEALLAFISREGEV